MSTLAERVQAALNEMPGASPSSLARACGIKPASVAGWLNGGTKSLKADTAYAASEYLGVSLLWLTKGNGPMRLADDLAHPAAPASSAQALPPTVDADAWKALTPKTRALIEELAQGGIADDDIKVLQAMADRMKKP